MSDRSFIIGSDDYVRASQANDEQTTRTKRKNVSRRQQSSAQEPSAQSFDQRVSKSRSRYADGRSVWQHMWSLLSVTILGVLMCFFLAVGFIPDFGDWVSDFLQKVTDSIRTEQLDT